jgi:hypothetical protein
MVSGTLSGSKCTKAEERNLCRHPTCFPSLAILINFTLVLVESIGTEEVSMLIEILAPGK